MTRSRVHLLASVAYGSVTVATVWGLVGCASSSAKQAQAPACQVGAHVTPIVSGLPSCASGEPVNATYSYACAAARAHGASGKMFAVYLSDSTLYGRGDGVWRSGPREISYARMSALLKC